MKIIDTTEKISGIKKSNGIFIKTESGSFRLLHFSPNRKEEGNMGIFNHDIGYAIKEPIPNVYYIVTDAIKLEHNDRKDFVTPAFDRYNNCIGFNEIDINELA